MEVRLNGKSSWQYVLPPDKTHHLSPRWRHFTALNNMDGVWWDVKYMQISVHYSTEERALKSLDSFRGLRNNAYLITWFYHYISGKHGFLHHFLEKTWEGWNTSNDMWDWLQLGSHTFWVWDFLKHSLFTSVPSESGQAPGWWVERKTADKQHWHVTHKTWTHMDKHKDSHKTWQNPRHQSWYWTILQNFNVPF